MHSVVRRFARTAVVFLLLGLAVGLLALVEREFFGEWPSPYLVSAHTHALLVGFVVMAILGAVLRSVPLPGRADVRRGLQAWGLLTVGTAARLLAEVGRSVSDASWLRWTVVVAALLQVGGVLAAGAVVWPAIPTMGRASAEAGEDRR